MKATDLIRSITISDVTPINMKVVTAWRGQTEDQFINGIKSIKGTKFRCSNEYEAYMLLV